MQLKNELLCWGILNLDKLKRGRLYLPPNEAQDVIVRN